MAVDMDWWLDEIPWLRIGGTPPGVTTEAELRAILGETVSTEKETSEERRAAIVHEIGLRNRQIVRWWMRGLGDITSTAIDHPPAINR